METSRPWTGIVTGDAGPYSDENWWNAWLNINGANRANTGPLELATTPPARSLQVTPTAPTSAAVTLLAGAALVTGTLYTNDADYNLSIGANGSGNDRIDTVVLRKDYTLQTVRAAVVAGTPAGSPTPPSLTQTDGVEWEIPIADVYASNGFATIEADDITPRHEYANTAPGLYLDGVLNNSGIVLETGDVVVMDTSADFAATTTTIVVDDKVLGVWIGRTANGDYGKVLTEGIGYVNVDASVSRGDLLSTNGTATEATTGIRAHFARALEARTGAGLVLAHVYPTRQRNSYAILEDQKSTGTQGGSASATTWNNRDLNTEVYDPDGIVTISSNQFTPIAGDYLIIASAPGFRCGLNRIRLYNVTGTASVKEGQGTFSSNTASYANCTAMLNAKFTANGTDAYRIDHYTQVAEATNGLGGAVSDGSSEVYLTILLIKIG